MPRLTLIKIHLIKNTGRLYDKTGAYFVDGEAGLWTNQ